MKLLQLAIATLSLVAATVSAAPFGEGIVGYGVGGEGCGAYLENRRRPNQIYDSGMVAWTYGYISAYNSYSPEPQLKRTVFGTTILAYLDKFCREYPLASTSVGIAELIKDYTKP